MKVEYGHQFIRLTAHVRHCISWVGHPYYEEALICIKSSFMSAEELKHILGDLDPRQLPYISPEVFIHKVKVSDKTLIYDEEIVAAPYDICIFPFKSNTVILNEKPGFEKTVPIQIYYHHSTKKEGFLKQVIHHQLQLSVSKNVEIPTERPIAYYYVNGLFYPITKEMLNHKLDVYTKLNDVLEVSINQELKKYLILKEE